MNAISQNFQKSKMPADIANRESISGIPNNNKAVQDRAFREGALDDLSQKMEVFRASSLKYVQEVQEKHKEKLTEMKEVLADHKSEFQSAKYIAGAAVAVGAVTALAGGPVLLSAAAGAAGAYGLGKLIYNGFKESSAEKDLIDVEQKSNLQKVSEELDSNRGFFDKVVSKFNPTHDAEIEQKALKILQEAQSAYDPNGEMQSRNHADRAPQRDL